MYQIAAQAVGCAATAIMIGSFQCKNSRRLVFLQFCANFIYLIHFLMLGAYSGCISLFLSCVRNYVIARDHPLFKKKWMPWLLITLNVAGTAYMWDGMLCLLPLLGVSALTLANWTRNGKTIRIANFAISSPVWIIYDLYTGSYPGIVNELFCMSSVVISILRHGWKALDTVES